MSYYQGGPGANAPNPAGGYNPYGAPAQQQQPPMQGGYGGAPGGYSGQAGGYQQQQPQAGGYQQPGAYGAPGGYQQQQQRPPAPANPMPQQQQQGQGVDRQWLYNVFQQVDKDRSGRIEPHELQASLANGTWQPFNIDTCKLMIGMFDKDNDQRISFDEFHQLWNFVDTWTKVFKQHDRDNSGSIDTNELRACLGQFGYRLSDMMCDLMVQRFDRTRQHRVLFDDFVQLCIALQTVTGVFRDKDADRDGVVTINYEEFLAMVFTLHVWDRK